MWRWPFRIVIDKEIYLTQLKHVQFQIKLCNLLISLYKLKKTPKQQEKLDDLSLGNEFSTINVDKSIYTKSKKCESVIISLYVNDMLIFCTCNDIVPGKRNESKFEIKDVGETSAILEVRLMRKRDSILLSKSNILRNFLWSLTIITLSINTPYDTNYKLKKYRRAWNFQPQLPKSLGAYT